ncbi:MAG: pirin family protein [Myxococcaceae bacterium]
MSRLVVIVALLALASACARKEAPVSVVHRPASTLPTTTLDWLSLRDHFIATVGPQSGQGQRFGPLLVLADATFAPRSRFPLHPHRDMEILSVVLEGEMSHVGDGANGMTVKPRGAQLISARSGMRHAEGNETGAPVRMLQIWLEPTSSGGDAAYFYRQLPAEAGRHLVAGDEGMPLRLDAKVWWLDAPQRTNVAAGRRGYVIALSGNPKVGGQVLAVGDGAEVSSGELVVEGTGAVLLLDVK